MRFRVTRASNISSSKSPCEGAFKEERSYTDTRNVDSPDKLGKISRKWWFRMGRNHRVENGEIKRDFDVIEWFVDISSLDSLIEFIDKHGDIVITPVGATDEVYNLEIYDDFRE